MATKAPFERLIRFESDNGQVLYGDLPASKSTDDVVGSEVSTIEGDFKTGFKKGSSKSTVRKVSQTARAT